MAAADVLATAARRARSQLETSAARTVHVAVGDALVLHADAALLDRALGNLVDNAVRYGDGTIALTADRLEMNDMRTAI